MQVERLAIPDVLLLRPRVFEDERGRFFESWSRDRYREAGILEEFVQDNISVSKKGVLRGLHAQRPPHAQGKLVSVLQGRVFDVAVDIRRGSPTFTAWCALEMDCNSGVQLYIPPGCLHGFLALEDETIVQYKCTASYDAASEFSVRWDEPAFEVRWPSQPTLLSQKDAGAPAFSDTGRKYFNG